MIDEKWYDNNDCYVGGRHDDDYDYWHIKLLDKRLCDTSFYKRRVYNETFYAYFFNKGCLNILKAYLRLELMHIMNLTCSIHQFYKHTHTHANHHTHTHTHTHTHKQHKQTTTMVYEFMPEIQSYYFLVLCEIQNNFSLNKYIYSNVRLWPFDTKFKSYCNNTSKWNLIQSWAHII